VVLRIPSKEVYEGETNIYTVKSGDSLYKIAQNNNTTVDEIKRLNNLTSNNLIIGQTLKLPSPLTLENTYTVKSGDSLYKIAQKYNTTVDELKRANNLTSNILSVGQILKLPNTSSETPSSNTVDYTVKSGDSLYKIANQYNVTVDAIKRANNLTTNNLQIGQVLRIPLGTSRETTYTVKSGDSLYSIAKKYNTTVNRLKELNNLSSNLLNIGQILIVG
jgi:N-acetylmuramoyl-L-alanine amidase